MSQGSRDQDAAVIPLRPTTKEAPARVAAPVVRPASVEGPAPVQLVLPLVVRDGRGRFISIGGR